MILNIYKPKGLTPLQTITLLRKKFPEYLEKKIGFAGRLDPLAHGVLLLMIDEETTKEKDIFLNLPKEYEFEAIFGVATDTYDALGLVNNETMKQSYNETQTFKIGIQEFIKKKLGKQIQPYPPYSSKTVDGKPLYLWARAGKLNEITIPTREIEIYDFQLLETKNISAEKLQEEIMKQIDSVTGDFRQEEIKNKWEDFFSKYSSSVIPVQTGIQKTLDSRIRGNDKIKLFQTAKFRIACSSGTYVRSLVNDLGNYLGTGAITLDILRTKVGEYSLSDSQKLV